MTARVMVGILLLHVATTFGAVAASAQPPACEGSRDFLCGTPVEGLFGRADEVSVSANPFRFAGSVLTLIGIMEGLTWYDYEILNESEYVLVWLWVFLIKGFFFSLRLYLLWRALGIIAQAVGRFFGR